ncbi:hypothetical protein [Kurthia massiliensis]|uniref:hypothetical protein n=1 Tax=Kurthia massiliensis TaxID=1033739 RepID=UPI00028A3BE5|nr:hypothetical protein [Kurthia massiliensis]
MKKVMSLVVAASLLLAACGEEKRTTFTGASSKIGPVAFDEKEKAILSAVDQTEQNFISYEASPGEQVILKKYSYQNGEVTEQEIDLDKSSGIINVGFTLEQGQLAFKINGSTHHYGNNEQSGYMSHRIDEDVVLSTTPTLIATYEATFKEDGSMTTEHQQQEGQPYKKMDPTQLDDETILIDIVAYVKKK